MRRFQGYLPVCLLMGSSAAVAAGVDLQEGVSWRANPPHRLQDASAEPARRDEGGARRDSGVARRKAPAQPEQALRPDGLAAEAGGRARLHFDAEGHLLIGTFLALQMAPEDRPEQVIDRLLERFPQALPAPHGLSADTTERQIGPVRILHRTWSHRGTTIDGLSLTVHLDALDRVVVISSRGLGYLERPIASRRLSRGEAEALGYLEAARSGLSPRQVVASEGLVVTSSGLLPVWRVGIDPEPPGMPLELRIDARSGDLLAVLPRATPVITASDATVSTASDATVSTASDTAASDTAASDTASPTGMAAIAEDETTARGMVYSDDGNDGGVADVSLPDLSPLSSYMTGSYADVWQYGTPSTQTAAATSSGEEVRYDYPPIEAYSNYQPSTATQTDTFAEVMMYYHVNRVHQYFNGLGYFNDDPSVGIDRPISATVNYRSVEGYYNNAYYASPAGSSQSGTIVFGQGQLADFTYDSSVIYHEYGHAVVDGTSKYVNFCLEDQHGSDCTQGGLNEGTADYFASSLRGDPLVGDYAIGRMWPSYVRDLRDPNRCPDDLYGEVHEDGRIWGAGMWDVRTALAGDDTALAHSLVDPIILAAISTPLPSDATGGSAFSYAADILLTDADAAVTAGALTGAQRSALENVLIGRGLVGCKRFVPLQSGEEKEGSFSAPPVLFGGGRVAAAGLQYTIQTRADTEWVRFSLEGLDAATFYVRADQPVEFYDSDDVVADYSTTELEFRLEPAAGTLNPGSTYYVAFTAGQTLETALYGYYYQVEAVVKSAEPEESGGCSCGDADGEAAGGGGGGILMAMGLSRLGLWRLKRRGMGRWRL